MTVPLSFSKNRRICGLCGLVKPLDQFPKSKGGHGACNECNRSKENDRERMKTAKKKSTAFRTLVSQIMGTRIQVPHICETTAEIIRVRGNLTKIAEEFWHQVDEAIERNPGSKTVLDAYKMVFQLVKQSTEQRDSAPDLASLTDDELNRELKALTAKMIFEEDGLLEEIAEMKGMRLYEAAEILEAEVVRPDGDDEGPPDEHLPYYEGTA